MAKTNITKVREAILGWNEASRRELVEITQRDFAVVEERARREIQDHPGDGFRLLLLHDVLQYWAKQIESHINTAPRVLRTDTEAVRIERPDQDPIEAVKHITREI